MALEGVLKNFGGLLGPALGRQRRGPRTGCNHQTWINSQSLLELGERSVSIALFEQGLPKKFVARGIILPLNGQPILRYSLVVTLPCYGLVPGFGMQKKLALILHQMPQPAAAVFL